jgi:hypothetical protein
MTVDQPRRFTVTCCGDISPSSMADLEAVGIDVDPGGSVGGATPPGGRMPDRPRRYHLRFEASDASSAKRRAEEAVKSAGAFCSGFEAHEDLDS